MRIGIIAFLHETNTFSNQPTTIQSFRENLLLSGEAIRSTLTDADHEVGGFLEGLKSEGAEAVPLFAAQALPAGPIESADFDALMLHLLNSIHNGGTLDGILVASHGAAVSENHSDADGYWFSELRKELGKELPIIGTIDAHANLSPLMVESCNALIASRTNPPRDQRERGVEAAKLMVRRVKKEVLPMMSMVSLPLLVSDDRRSTEELDLEPLHQFADKQLKIGGILSNSIVLGFPSADVEEMGSSVIAVTDNQELLAKHFAGELAQKVWDNRAELAGKFTTVEEFIRVDTDSSKSANSERLEYQHRRRPMYPFEPECDFNLKEAF
ncbi:M81 family metallopeptidase [Planctomicrobium sp.]|jgi:microcystin degradation protein MlrC|nr:M81 family metallopeptidase [Planctomicrobium sp.]MDB4743854.1 M81 family metallopeptidase [Planctomicrobium sp.]